MNTRLKNGAIWLANTVYNAAAPEAPRRCQLPRDPFPALNEFFDMIWVLTIPRNADRRANVDRQFQGLRFQYFDGIDGRTIREGDPRVDFRQASAAQGRPFLVNEAACALSHRAMLEAVVRGGLRNALIFEDDVALVPTVMRWIPYCLEHLPENWELFYLGYRDGELRGYLREVQEAFGRSRNPQEVVSRRFSRGLRTAAGHELTHAYAVSREGARKLLDGMDPIRDVADGWMEKKVLARQVSAYVSVPKLFLQQSDLGSSIHA